MKDRVSVNPGRVLITPESGSPYYATLTRADNPTQEGDYLNKNTLLKDATAALFGLGPDAVPDNVFTSIKTLIESNTALANTKAQIASGWYIGTGSSVSLTFNFVPKILILTRFTYQSGETGSETGYIRGMSENFTSVIDIGALREAIEGEYKYSGTSNRFSITMYSAYNTNSTFTLTFTPSNDWKTITFSSSSSLFVAPTRIHTYTGVG